MLIGCNSAGKSRISIATWLCGRPRARAPVIGDDAASVLPSLLSLRTLTVQLPEYLVRALETMAAEDATTVDNWLHHELVDFAGTVVGRMETILPGFRRAYLFPGQG